jgi:hypothetical protein
MKKENGITKPERTYLPKTAVQMIQISKEQISVMRKTQDDLDKELEQISPDDRDTRLKTIGLKINSSAALLKAHDQVLKGYKMMSSYDKEHGKVATFRSFEDSKDENGIYNI